MNVTPVSTPGPVSAGRISTDNAPRQQVTTEPAEFRSQALVDPTVRGDYGDRQKAEQLRAYIADDAVRLSTYHDEESGRSVLEVRDQTTGDVVTQYPSEELVRLYAALRSSLVDQRV